MSGNLQSQLNTQPSNLFDAYEIYKRHLRKIINSQKNYQSAVNETQSGIFRCLLPYLGYCHQSASKKMTKAEVIAAQTFMKTVTLAQIRDVSVISLDLSHLSQASRKVYGARVKQFLQWLQQQTWYTTFNEVHEKSQSHHQNHHCPKLRHQFGEAIKNRLTDRRFVTPQYKLQDHEMSLELKKELQEFYAFLTIFNEPNRRMKAVSASTAHTYVQHLLLMLGWFKTQGIPKLNLRLDLLVPRLSSLDLNQLNDEQQLRCWQVRKVYVETWIYQYFQFLRDIIGSKSPKTKQLKTHALTALGKFQYRNEIRIYQDYDLIPIMKILKKVSQQVKQEISHWDKHQYRVVPREKKWPAVAPDETQLAFLREQVTEKLRLSCNPKYMNSWTLRSSRSITVSLRNYLAWMMLTDLPARRQEELRSLRISLCCPIVRPSINEIPEGAFYHPLPPESERQKSSDLSLSDNFLYKTYHHEGGVYPCGIWLMEINQYKTDKQYGSQVIKISNRYFQDGRCVYDYIETYLYGWKQSLSNPKLPYSQMEESHQSGKWVTPGRSKFNPNDSFKVLPNGKMQWQWGYFFIMPNTGKPYDDSAFKAFFSTAAHQLTGLRITPHILRNVWATWAFQVGLSDADYESLAYAMGTNIDTLRKIYENCSPDEKRRPIEKVIEQNLYQDKTIDDETELMNLDTLAQAILELSKPTQKKILNLIHTTLK